MDVVIVESPAKAKTINKYLGENNAIVLASYGHIRDLPERNGSVDPDNDFRMAWEERRDMREIASAMRGADRLVLATDPDREGEAISWHVLEVLQEKGLMKGKDVCRVVFNAITRTAVLDAMDNPRQIDDNLVSAYLARRALDYLVGFNLSPVLWRKLPGARSAGRVQSVALRLICQRELEIEQFVPREYWSVDTLFETPDDARFTARLAVWDGKRADRFTLGTEAEALAAQKAIETGEFGIETVESKPEQRSPAPPFTTSTLQQEASRKLNFNANRTMRTAQKLYEDGYITYMRTDGLDIAPEAIEELRVAIERDFGAEYVPSVPRKYTKKALNAQEAHEAVRPTAPGRTPTEVMRELDDDGAKLYDLVWKRAMASQMKNAEVQRTTITVTSQDRQIGLRATGTVITFSGFLKLYEEGEDDKAKDDDKETTLPKVSEGASLKVCEIAPEQHFTAPPPRYNEASLVKKMEELGIGRPSTYAGILSVLRERDYVQMDGKRFVPQDKGRLVIAFLESFFTRYVEYDFTANLEGELDKVADGSLAYKEMLAQFWGEFHRTVEGTMEIRNTAILDRMNEELGQYVFKDGRQCPKCEKGELSLKTGRFGAFVGCTLYPDCAYTRPFAANADEGTDIERILGKDPETDLDVHVKDGRFGAYVQLGETIKDSKKEEDKPKRATIPKGKTPEEMDLEYALKLLALPRVVGEHPESGDEITAAIGRYGPYVRAGKMSASLENVDEVFDIGVNRAVIVLANKPKGRGRAGSAVAAVIKELGEHPDTKKPIQILKGRYGPYVKCEKINASIPKDEDPETLPIERAMELLAARAAKGPAKKRKKAAKKK